MTTLLWNVILLLTTVIVPRLVTTAATVPTVFDARKLPVGAKVTYLLLHNVVPFTISSREKFVGPLVVVNVYSCPLFTVELDELFRRNVLLPRKVMLAGK